MLSPSTLALLKELLDQVTLSAAHPEFDEMATRVSTARRELTAALDASADDESE